MCRRTDRPIYLSKNFGFCICSIIQFSARLELFENVVLKIKLCEVDHLVFAFERQHIEA